MKTNTPKSLFHTILLFIFYIGISVNGYAQCGPESMTTDQWCENGFAKWTFNSPTANTWYEWYSYTPAPYVPADFDANGHLIRTGSVFYDSTQSSYYYSPFRITTATAPPAGVQLTYIKRTSYPAVNPKPAVAPAFTSNPAGTVMEMSFTNTMPVRFNTIKVPVVLNTVGQTYKIQITFGTTGGPGSAVYNFSTVGATLISGNNYYVEVPVNYTLTTVGTTKIVVNSNPTGTGSAVDGLLFSPAQPATTTSGPITIPANSASTTGGKYGVLYDWNYTAICPPETTALSTKKTSGCCVAPASINILTLSSNKATIINGSETAVLTVGNYSSASNYFDWYLNGVNVPAASGAGKISYTTNQVGNWEVHELTGASPAAADKTNPSCYSSDGTRIDDKLIFASVVTAPSTSPLCIGDTWSLSGAGSSNLTWSTGGGTLSNSSGSTTTFTATQVGTTQVILTGTVTSGDLVVNGNFSAGATGFVTSMPGPVDPRSTDGSYNVANTSGNWGAQGDWTFNGTKPFVTGNPGNFLIVNGEDASSITKPVVWGQKINGLTANQNYTFSFDFTSICYVVSANTGGYSNAPGTAPFYDVELEVYINGVLIGSASTDFATNGGVDAVGIWKNHAYTWNSAASSFANIEIRQKNLFPMRGYDFGLDNIKFGGLQTQTDAITIGPVTDCSAITATASACINDTYSDLTAVATGGLIFDHWELKSSGATVSTANPYRVQTLTATQYDAVGYVGIGNVLSNGDFNSGNIGFISGSPYYTYAGTGHGDNQYSVDVSISTHNAGWWIDIPQAPGQSATSMRYIADAKTGSKILAWTFTANQNDKFAFSGYIANIHKDALGPDTTNTGIPSAIGVYINNVLIAGYWTKNDRDWHQLTGNWTAPLAGSNTYTLEVRNLKLNSGGGNDFALDDFRLVPLTGTPKKFTVTTPVCNPCLLDIPTVATSTFCGNSGTVKLTPAATETYPASVAFDWYNTVGPTGGTKLGTSVGNASATIDVSTVPTNGSGNKIVYYQKTVKGSGTVFKQSDACDATFGGTSNTIDASNVNQLEQRYTASKAITLTGLSFNVVTKPYQSNITLAGTITYTVYGSKSYNGGLIADRTVVYGSMSQAYTRAVTTQSDLSQIISVTGSVAVPAGDFFIVASITGTSGNGAIVLGKSDCSQTVPKVDDLNGTTVSRTGSANYGNPDNAGNIKMGTSFNIKFALPAYVCPRTPVTLTPNCPCTKPSVVDITTPAAATLTICQGTAQTLSGTVTVTAAAQNTAFNYSWIKMGATPAADVVLQTAVIAIPANTPTAVPNYTGITGTVAQAGKYILRVEDGNLTNASCFRDDTLTLVVNATTVPGVIATAQTICTGGDPAAFTVTTAASGGTGTFTYQWEKSTNSGAYGDITNATNATYDEGVLTNAGTTAMTVDYRRKVTSGVCPQVTSNTIRITVNPAVVPGVVATDQTICSGGDPAAFTQTTAATGGSGTYTYQWQSATTNTPASFGNIASATNATYDAPSGLTTTTYYRRVDASGICATAATNVITVTVQPPLVAGVIAAAQTICTGGDPAAFTVTTAASGGSGTYVYQWEKSTNSGAYGDITNATNATYDEGVLTNAGTTAMTVDYRRKVTSGACSQVSTAAIRITVNPAVVPGVVATDQTICSGGDPAAFTQTTAATGGSGTYTYQWQSATTNTPASFGNIASATNATYDAPAGLTTTTYYRRVDASGTCATAATNVITVTVTPNVTPSVVIATPATTICNGTSVTFTATPTNGGTTPGYQWYKGAVPGTAIGSATNATYTTTTAANNDSYYVVMTSTANCPSPATATSNVIVMTVTTVVTPAVSITAAPGNTICAGASVTFTASPGNGGSAPTYEWFIGTTSQGAPSTTATTFTSTTLANGNQVKVIMTSNSTCVVAPGTATSNVITMTVNPNVTPSVAIAVSPTGAICPGTSITFTATPTNGGTPTYQWYKGAVPGTAIGSATNATYTTTTAANNDNYYVVMTSTATCASPATATSNVIVITVTPVPTISVSITSDKTSICANNPVVFTAAVTGSGSTPAPTYQWFITTASTATGGTSQGAPSTTATTFTTSALTAASNKVYVQVVSNATCAATTPVASNVIAITVNTGIGAGTIGSDQTICYNATPVPLTETAAPTGIAGTPTYIWEASATASGTFTTVPGTGQGYTFPIGLPQDVFIRRVITDPGTPAPCNVATSNTIHITVNPQLVAGTISGNETTCANVATATITSTSLPTGGTGTYTYQWRSSTTAGGPYTNIASATNATYSPGILTTTTYFVRVETSGTCGNVTSNEVTKTVNPVLVPGVSIAASPATICTNGSTTFTATPTNPGAAPMYEWFVKGVSQGAPAASATFSTTLLTASTDVVKVIMTSNALCATPATAQASMSVTVNTGIGAGTIGTDQTICYNATPVPLTQTVAPTNIAGTPTYTWEASLTGAAGTFSTIPGAGQGYTFPAVGLTQDVYIRRIITDPGTPAPCNVATSNTVHITVRPQLIAGVIGSDETICSGTAPATMIQTTAPTGGTGTYTYQWQSDASGTMQNIPGATNSSYTSGAITALTHFQRIETSCGSVTGNVVTKNVTTPEAYTVSINDPGVTCTGPGSSMTFTATATPTTPVTGTLTYTWFRDGSQVATGITYTYSPVLIGDDNKVITVVVTTSNSCSTAPWTSNAVTLDIVNATTPTVSITTLNNPNCAGLVSTFTASSTGGGSLPTYQWYVVPAGSAAGATGNLIAGATNVTYSTSTLTNGDRVRVQLTSNLPCLIGTNPFKSNEITMVIKPIPAPTIAEGDQTICSPNSFTFHGAVTPGNTFEWRNLSNGGAVVGTGIDFTASQSGTYALYEDNGTCNSTSAPVTLNVIPTPIANAGTDIYIRQGDAGSLNGSGGAVYSWSPATYLSNAGISNPSFTATQTITYTLTVSDATNTCSSTDDVTVIVVSPIKVPNVITVNGDGTNDDWEIENIEGYPNVIIEIYNRWGNLVWKSEGYPKNWDGTNYRNGEVLAEGTYFYIINLQSDVYPEPLTGWIQIVK